MFINNFFRIINESPILGRSILLTSIDKSGSEIEYSFFISATTLSSFLKNHNYLLQFGKRFP